MGNNILLAVHSCERRVCVCVLTNKTCIHSSVKVIGECIENIGVFKLIWLMNNALHHLKHFLVTVLESCVTWRGNTERSVTKHLVLMMLNMHEIMCNFTTF